ncbi:MAG TPA: alpha/beta fold hydrolase [Pseudonocardiaceae bacterium]|nr:alpha/beta fold hydrolase [Pseudonocardiaceae bacterium]
MVTPVRLSALAVTTTVTLALVLLVGCTVGPSQRPGLVVAGSVPAQAPPPPTKSSALPPLERPAQGAIGWTDCDTVTRQRLSPVTLPPTLTFQCARVVSALDSPSAPGEGLVRLQLLKVGQGPTPLLVVNDLNGLPGTLYAAELAAQLPPAFLNTFSLIGMDRRGTGGSDPVHCVPAADREQIVDYDPTDTDLTGLLGASLDASQQCILALDTRSAALDTQRTAEDVDTVRQQLGVRRIDAIGHGEGSRVLTAYADRFPGHVGRMVLDGSPDPTLDATGVAKARAAAAEATFTAFASDCQSRGACPLGGAPDSTLEQLLAQLRTRPEPLADGGQLTNGTALNAVLAGLADRSDWPALATAIARAHGGDGAELAAFVGPVVAGTATDPPRLDADLASGCNDQQDRLAPAQVAATMKAWTGAFPLFGGLLAQSLLLCGPWPVPDQPLPKPVGKGAPPILLLSTANDPVTPGTGSQRTAQQLDSGVLVNWLGSGHGALGQSACATQAAQHYLINGTVPANPTTCPP